MYLDVRLDGRINAYDQWVISPTYGAYNILRGIQPTYSKIGSYFIYL